MQPPVKYTINGDTLRIECDISEASVRSAPLSSSGRTRLVASSGRVVIGAIAGKEITFNISVMASR